MSEHELEKLLGGFAADTLTEEERQRLYRAALDDQRLFDALADEQALKDLLADPAVRSRLLKALRGAPDSADGRRLPWREWFRRPMNLALAGGLASAAVAVVLGTTIYRDSLMRAARESPAPREEGIVQQPAAKAPSSQVERQAASQEKDIPIEPARPDAGRTDRRSRDRTADPKHPPTQPSLSLRADTSPADKPVGQDQFGETHPASPPVESAPPSLDVTPAAPAAGQAARVLSARSLFHRSSEPQGIMSDRPTSGHGEGEATELRQPEKKRLQPIPNTLGKAEATARGPLGIRYSLMITGPGGLDLEIDPATAVGQDDRPRVTVQTTEPGYLSIRAIHGDQAAILLPAGPVAARTPVTIALSPVFAELRGVAQVRLAVLLTRTMHDAGKAPPQEATAGLMIEQVSPESPGARAEQAVYAVDPRSERSRLLVEMPLHLRPN